ncbi:unnamed protein product [Parascedosporium putredinis]|uniref:Uncharacterized protein n=1 Tax=Parascedosporium putredinis TaxID=1442378 RepID=A0A9P1MCK0_9PEZI|nr:unnamed protein product [Parascedosporium putredinis]CAI7998566.1 unnamed protein product [Parascedosporium putredinis]
MTSTYSAAGRPDGYCHSLTTSSSYGSLRSQSQSNTVHQHPDLQHTPPTPKPDAGVDILSSNPNDSINSAAPISEWADAVLSSALASESDSQPGGLLSENHTQPAHSIPSSSLSTPTSNPANNLSSSPATAISNSSKRQARKPSPGLAARLKALGFGTKTSPPATPTTTDDAASLGPLDRVGKLNQQHIRQIDESHQQNSKITVVERRGRPWKGLGLGLLLDPSLAAPLGPYRAPDFRRRDSA